MLPSAAAASSLLLAPPPPRAWARYASVLAFGFLVSYQCRFLTAIHDEQLSSASAAHGGPTTTDSSHYYHALALLEGSVLLSLMKSNPKLQDNNLTEEEAEQQQLLDDSYYYFDDAEEAAGGGEEKDKDKEDAAAKDNSSDDEDDAATELDCPAILRRERPGSPLSQERAMAEAARRQKASASPELARVWKKILSGSPPKASVVIDVGGSAGSATGSSDSDAASRIPLWLALEADNRDVPPESSLQLFAFDADRERAARLCESAVAHRNNTKTTPSHPKINNNVHVYSWTATDRDDAGKRELTLDQFATQRGWIRSKASAAAAAAAAAVTTTTGTEDRDSTTTQKTNSIAMLRLRAAPGQEVRALRGAAKLLQSGLVLNVFVELPAAGLNDSAGPSSKASASSNLEGVLQQLVGEFKYSLVGWGGGTGFKQRPPHQQLRQKKPPSASELAAVVSSDVPTTDDPNKSVHLWFVPTVPRR
jgi:hypothetical protein